MTMTTPILKPAGLCTSQPKVAVVTKLFDSDSDGESEFSKLSRSRRPSYFQSCMNRFIQLAAYVETELGQSRRDWKHKITPWRNEQRDLVMKMAQTGASGRKTFQWIRQHVTMPWNATNKDVWENGKVNKIYARVNIFAPTQRYIGMHEGPSDQRDIDHLRKAFDSDKLDDHQTLYSQRYAKQHGGAAMWIDVPVYVLPPGATRIAAHRVEKWAYQQWGTLNRSNSFMRHGPRTSHSHFQKKGGRQSNDRKPRRRPVCSLRERHNWRGDRHETSENAGVIMYELPEGKGASPDFTVMLNAARKVDGELRITVTDQKNELSNVTTAKRQYKETELGITFADGQYILTTVCGLFRLLHERLHNDINRPQYESIRFIDILYLKFTEFGHQALSAVKLAKQIGTHPNSSRRIANQLSHDDLVRVYRAARHLTDVRVRKRAEEQLAKVSRKLYHISLTATAAISYPASISFPKHLLRRAGRSLIGRIDGFEDKPIERLKYRLRTVRTRADTVGTLLHNHKKICNDFDPDNPPECMCHRAPRSWRRRRQFGGHFCILSAEYDGPGRDALRCSHKSPVEITNADVFAELYKGLSNMRRTLPAVMQLGATDELIKEITRETVARHTVEQQRNPTPYPDHPDALVTKTEVLKVKRHLRHMCLSPIDKGAGRTAIMCPQVMWQCQMNAWPDEPDRCEVICPADASEETVEKLEREILMQDIEIYKTKDWQRIAKLYGVDPFGRPVNAALPRGYANPKLKAILAAKPGRKATNIMKARPISPHTKIPLKNVTNRNATGHHFLLTKINTQRLTRMWATTEYPVRLRDEQLELQRRHTTRGGGQLKFLAEIGDLVGMYQFVTHERMHESLVSNIARVKNSTEPNRRFPQRNLDRVAVGRRKQDGLSACALGPAYNLEEQVEIRFSDMIDICDYSNDRSIMRIGKQIRQYVMGTPMGEPGSCAKANGVCLDDELNADAEREKQFGDSERNVSLAFVDDKHIRVAYDDILWSKESAQEYLEGLRTYSAPLKMETETLGRTNEFIETATIYPDCEGTVVYTTHKRRDFEGRSYRIARGSVQGTADMQIATATGTFMRIVDNSSYESDAAISIAREMYEMAEGADMSRKDVFGALKALHGTRNTAARGKKMRGFTKRYERIIRILFDGFFFK